MIRLAHLLLAIGFFAAVFAAAAPPPSSAKPVRQRQSVAMKNALEALTKEAQRLQREQTPPPDRPDFASRFSEKLATGEIQAVISKRFHRDPVIDAYVRWQLTSFNPGAPPLEEAQYLNLLATLPELIANPRADSATVEGFQKAEKSGPLPAGDFQRLQQASVELDQRTKLIESVNRPAEQFRDWLADQYKHHRIRSLQLLIERCAATINGGWPSRDVKSKMTKAFKEAGDDKNISSQQKQVVAEQARKLAGLKRSAINHITFLADGTVNVTFTYPAIDDDDVAKWIKSLGL